MEAEITSGRCFALLPTSLTSACWSWPLILQHSFLVWVSSCMSCQFHILPQHFSGIQIALTRILNPSFLLFEPVPDGFVSVIGIIILVQLETLDGWPHITSSTFRHYGRFIEELTSSCQNYIIAISMLHWFTSSVSNTVALCFSHLSRSHYITKCLVFTMNINIVYGFVRVKGILPKRAKFVQSL